MSGRWLADLLGTKAASFAASYLKLTPQTLSASASGSTWVDGTSNRLTSYDGTTNQQYTSQADAIAIARNIAAMRTY